ncbi:SURF1 family protein [Streptomyces hainanensis]|uniref:SURF1-like protein n=1 Tax=Streptomyces hainanensis TaxID=402648 RepID=A0A4R4T590_9ACTN|nr:SURF1 family protein [Streptomyces hainanensis]TDC72201.1 SURF1 family protein [Streptomyces hainanensis]
MYRFLLSRQWVILTLITLLLIPTMVWLGFWQLHRHEQRVARNDLIAGSLEAPSVPMTDLSSVGGAPDPDDRYRAVTVTGVYDTDHQVVVRNRTNGDGAVGYHVLTPIVAADGTAAVVNRGWIESGPDLTRTPEIPAPPTGEVTVTGRLMADETTDTTGIRERSGLPTGMVMMISSQERAAETGEPTLGGYLELTETSPEPAGQDGPAQPAPLPEPDHTGIGAHLAYAFQWWIFAAGVPVGWFLLLRREIQDRRKEAAREAKAAEAAAAEASAAGPAGGAEPAAGLAETGNRSADQRSDHAPA